MKNFNMEKSPNLKQIIRRKKKKNENEKGENIEEDLEKECTLKYKCNFVTLEQILLTKCGTKKLDQHTGQSVNFNSMDKNDTKNSILNFVAEQNADIIEELMNLKKSMKEFLDQL